MVLDMDEWRTLGVRSGYWVVSAIECGGSGGVKRSKIDNRIRSCAIIVRSAEFIVGNKHRKMDYRCFE